jgi:NAD(P)-dependent dehydrogenase (short-subunit alcohol dehydrogenase family)
MSRVFITGSTDGLGRAAARALIHERAAAVHDLAPLSLGVVVDDLGNAIEARGVADQVNALGHMDAVIFRTNWPLCSPN